MSKGYQFILEIAKNNDLPEQRRIAAIQALVDLAGESTIDELIEIYNELGMSLRLPDEILAAIAKIEIKNKD